MPKRIAWDGVSFLIPDNWELALYKFLKRGVTRIEIEDEFTVRLEVEWVRPRRKLHMDHILERYEVKSKRLTKRADRSRTIKKLPQGWFATCYDLSETAPRKGRGGLEVLKQKLLTAFYLSPESSVFSFMLLHFVPEDSEDPAEVIRLIASGFKHHLNEKVVPWQLYDIAFELPPDFYLESTLFDIGAKLMTFRWRMRRLHIWHLSCADMFLKDGVSIPEWLTAYINDSRMIKGGVFRMEDDRIVWRRRRRHFIGTRDEIARYCFRYEVRWYRDNAENQLTAWVFNYRKPEDLEVIPESLRFTE